MPMIIGKQERTLAIDGPYIHVSDWHASFPPPTLFLRGGPLLKDHADGQQGRQGSF